MSTNGTDLHTLSQYEDYNCHHYKELQMRAYSKILIVLAVLAVVYEVARTAAGDDIEPALFLPVVAKPVLLSTPTPTATPGPTATPEPTATATLPPLLTIPNGDFEQGSGFGWYEYRSYANRPLIVQTAPGLPVTPRSGQWFAWLGGDHLLGETPNHQSRIVHMNTFDLPAGIPIYLHLHYQIISEEEPDPFGICDRDVINIWINNILIEQGQICHLYNTDDWTAAVIDLSVFAGQTVSLEFEMRTDFENISHLFLDDISLYTE